MALRVPQFDTPIGVRTLFEVCRRGAIHLGNERRTMILEEREDARQRRHKRPREIGVWCVSDDDKERSLVLHHGRELVSACIGFGDRA